MPTIQHRDRFFVAFLLTLTATILNYYVRPGNLGLKPRCSMLKIITYARLFCKRDVSSDWQNFAQKK